MAQYCDNFYFRDSDNDSFEFWNGLRGPAGPQGPAGAPGAPGTSVELRGPVETTGDLPATASSSELWLVGSAAPYHGWFYNGEAWEDAGEIAVGPTGPQGPAGTDGADGADGVTFTPAVSSAGVISWTNDGGLPNPESVNIKGPQGETGAAGSDGADGSNGATFTPAVSSAGVISWTNDGGLPNPDPVNIKGPQGQTGQTGPAGQDGTDGSDGVTFTPSVSSAGVISWTNDGGLPNPQSVNIKGPQGETGATGPAGPGVPAGGTAGQVLKKTSSTDYDTAWGNEDLGITGATVGKVPVISAVDGNGVPTAFSPGDGGDVTADMLGIVIDGNSTPVGASVGQYVIVKNSTISGITDGLYTAAQAIPANTAIDATYLTAVSSGGLNALNDSLVKQQTVTASTDNSGAIRLDNLINGTIIAAYAFTNVDNNTRCYMSTYCFNNVRMVKIMVTNSSGNAWTNRQCEVVVFYI